MQREGVEYPEKGKPSPTSEDVLWEGFALGPEGSEQRGEDDQEESEPPGSADQGLDAEPDQEALEAESVLLDTDDALDENEQAETCGHDGEQREHVNHTPLGESRR